MTVTKPLEIFLACAPGLEPVLAQEAKSKGFKRVSPAAGGVGILGQWPDVWRANLWLRGTNRVTVRIAQFHADRLDDIERRTRTVPWANFLKPGLPFNVEATSAKSRLYHTGAITERITTAIQAQTSTTFAPDAPVTIMARMAGDTCSLSIDTSGELLHKRGYKEAVGRAPMRETLAALFLTQCGYDGREPVLDPMCGSGTFVIEAAEIAAGLNPGRHRSFAFEQLATFDAAAWQTMRAKSAMPKSHARFYGSDRDTDAIAASNANAQRAGIASRTSFHQTNIADLQRPEGPPGLVIVNPPYGERIGEADKLTRLYRSFGDIMRERFAGWRVGIVTSDKSLAYACALPFEPPTAPVAHGGLRITLLQTKTLT